MMTYEEARAGLERVSTGAEHRARTPRARWYCFLVDVGAGPRCLLHRLRYQDRYSTLTWRALVARVRTQIGGAVVGSVLLLLGVMGCASAPRFDLSQYVQCRQTWGDAVCTAQQRAGPVGPAWTGATGMVDLSTGFVQPYGPGGPAWMPTTPTDLFWLQGARTTWPITGYEAGSPIQ